MALIGRRTMRDAANAAQSRLERARSERPGPAGAGGVSRLALIAALIASAPAAAQTPAPEPESNAPTLTQQLRQRISNRGQNELATLEADQIDYDPNSEIVRASGDVRVYYEDRELRADELIYNGGKDEIVASGDVQLINPDGSVVAADGASFDSELKNGIIRSARAVLSDGKARMAAVEARREGGRYTTLSKVVFSPCKVCQEDPNPLWRIRARRIVQDEETRDIYYEDATFEVLGTPVAYLPFFSHADPSVKRRSGVLAPHYLSSDALGQALKIPYFLALAPNRDLTITPFLATEENPVLEGEYRAWESYGKFNLAGSATVSDDDAQDGFRGHFDGDGEFELGGDVFAGYDAYFASDDTYLRRYGYSSVDRTTSRLYAEKFGEQGFASAEGVYFQSFREDEFAGTIPLVLPSLEAEQSFAAPMVGGDLTFSAGGLSIRRTEGRDMSRITGEARWDRVATTEVGVVFDLGASVRGDAYYVQDDPAYDEEFVGRVLPLASLETSYPLGMSTENASHVVSPIVSLVYAPYGGNPEEIPNEDSLDAELDELSIFSESRFPGLDRWEEGPRATAGLRYQRLAMDDGPDVEAMIGQSYRLKDTNQFGSGSGLEDAVSDVVGSWQVSFDEIGVADNLSFGHRFRISDSLSFGRNEAYASTELFDRARLTGAYVFLNADPAAGALDDRSEATASAEIDLTQYWTVLGAARRDLEQDRFVNAGGGVRYSDECLEVDFSVNRRFNSVEDAPASTNFGLSLRLKSIDAN